MTGVERGGRRRSRNRGRRSTSGNAPGTLAQSQNQLVELIGDTGKATRKATGCGTGCGYRKWWVYPGRVLEWHRMQRSSGQPLPVQRGRAVSGMKRNRNRKQNDRQNQPPETELLFPPKEPVETYPVLHLVSPDQRKQRGKTRIRYQNVAGSTSGPVVIPALSPSAGGTNGLGSECPTTRTEIAATDQGY